MNRAEKRRAARQGRGNGSVKLLQLSVYYGGTVDIDGAGWGFLVTQRSIIARPKLELPDAMRRAQAHQTAAVKRYLTEAAPEHFSAARDVWQGVGEMLAELERDCGRAGQAIVDVDGASFLWADVAQALDFVEDGHVVAASLLRGPSGAPMLRVQSTAMRCVLACAERNPDAPGASLLDAAQNAALASSLAVHDGSPTDPSSPGGSA